jgi:hypothetical protein
MKIPSRSEVEFYRRQYPSGTRVCCDDMPEDPRPIPPGTKGNVVGVDDMCSIMIKWDNGRSLSLIPDVDSFHIIPQEESMNEEPDPEMQL